MNIVKKIIGIASAALLVSFLLFFLILLFEGYIIRKDIKSNGKFTVGKYILHQRFKKGYTNYFSFNINKIRYKGVGAGVKEGSYENIGKFYKIRYSKKFKGSLVAFFDQEVTDTTEILKAGFTMKDILSNENDTINVREASFKEEVFAILGLN